MPTAIDTTNMTTLLTELLGRDVVVTSRDTAAVHPATYRGLVTDENQLVAVIACDLDFAHRSGAALAMIPAATVSEPAETPDEGLMEIYGEVSNVLSRLVNESTPTRVRLDPTMVHSEESMQAIIDSGSLIIAGEAAIEGYSTGQLGFWRIG